MFKRVIFTIGCLAVGSSSYAHHSKTFDSIKKVPPVVPDDAQQSGYCCMIYDILPNGRTENITADYCTETILAQPSIDALSQWEYKKQRKDGTPVTAKNLTTYMAYQILDGDEYVPGKFDFMAKLPDGTLNREKPCGFRFS